jgi:hypothetical protein
MRTIQLHHTIATEKPYDGAANSAQVSRAARAARARSSYDYSLDAREVHDEAPVCDDVASAWGLIVGPNRRLRTTSGQIARLVRAAPAFRLNFASSTAEAPMRSKAAEGANGLITIKRHRVS